MQLIHPLTYFQSIMKYILTTMLIMGLVHFFIAGLISYYLANITNEAISKICVIQCKLLRIMALNEN